MKLSDYVVDRIASEKSKPCFYVARRWGYASERLSGKSNKINFICNLHEQACSIAAEAYAQLYTNNIGVCMVTTGPGSINAITGVASAWLDSIPMLVISGQVKTSDLSLKNRLGK